MTSAKRALIIDPLQKCAYEFFFRLLVHLIIFFPIHHILKNVHHYVSNRVSQVVGLMSEQDDEAAEIRVEDFWDFLA